LSGHLAKRILIVFGNRWVILLDLFYQLGSGVFLEGDLVLVRAALVAVRTHVFALFKFRDLLDLLGGCVHFIILNTFKSAITLVLARRQ